MKLTPQQLAARQNGIGASEVAAICGLDPWKTAAEVWLSKRTPTRGPVEVAAGPNPFATDEAGQFVEGAALAMYRRRTKRRTVRVGTVTHPEVPYFFATPDGIAIQDGRRERGIECKAVGHRMLSYWEQGEEGFYPPIYVQTQCAWSMYVTGLPRWDVAALLGGTKFAVWTIERDTDVESMLVEECSRFWFENVLRDCAPDTRSASERSTLVSSLHPARSVIGKETPEDSSPETVSAVARLLAARELLRSAKENVDEAEAAVAEIIGDRYGIRGPWGKALWYPRTGNVSWKDVALELAGGGEVPEPIIEKHRGAACRVLAYYQPSKRK